MDSKFCHSLMFVLLTHLCLAATYVAGAGVPDLGMVKIEFYLVSIRGGPQLPDAFYRIKKYCS